jgi:hypothetical protein
VACYILLKRCGRTLQLCFRPCLNQKSSHKVMGLQSCGSLNLGILRLQLENFGTKWHLGVGPVAMHKEYYKGEVWWLLPSLGCGESMFTCGSFMHKKCSNYALTNLLFGLCRFAWVIDLLITLPSFYFRTPARPSTPKVPWIKECTPTPHSFTVFTLDLNLNLLKILDVRLWCKIKITMTKLVRT